METNNIETTVDVLSTRQQILDKSLEIINKTGMVSFRIDSLATALNLSPGNITYHFSRKEDISVALWEAYLEEYDAVERQLTNLLDLRQIFLLNRTNIHLNYKYRGVLIFRSADQGAMRRDKAQGRNNESVHHNITKHAIEILRRKGYTNESEYAESFEKMMEMEKISHYIDMRWGINFAYQLYKPEDVEKNLDRIALLCIHSMYPILNAKGRAEFEEIAEIINNDDL